MAGLTWTKEEPTGPGWYWWRDGSGVEPLDYLRIVQLVDERGQLMEQDENYCFALIEGLWAGPIPPPEEPQS